MSSDLENPISTSPTGTGAQSSTPAAPVKTRKQWIIENVTSLSLAILLVLMVRSSIVEAFKIPSGSMIPNLLIGDHIFVNKFAYGLKLPFSDWVLDDPIYLIKREPPKRGDIVVFKFPQNPSLYYIKRVIGTPGDVVEIRDRVLYVNDQAIEQVPVSGEEQTEVEESLSDSKYDLSRIQLTHEKMSDEKNPVIMYDTNAYSWKEMEPVKVPEAKYFVMGDNRDFSNDSRFWGFVPENNIKGRAIVIWLSMWVSFKDSEFIFRPERIGTLLH